MNLKTALKNKFLKKNEIIKRKSLYLWIETVTLDRTFLEEWRNEFLEERKKKTSARTVWVPQHGASKGFCKNSTYTFQKLIFLCHLVLSVSYRSKI